jgi:carbonic anhydrase
MKSPPLSPEEALQLLSEGNARFTLGNTEGPHRTAEQRLATARDGQSPFAAIVSCADSRVPLELIFDRGIGDIFALRVAGNVSSPEIIGSLEYAVLHLRTPLVVMLGHSRCGALTAVVESEPVDDHVALLAERLVPAVDRAKARFSCLAGPALLEEAIKENVWFQIETLFTSSRHVRDAVRDGRVRVVAGVYDIERGAVTWLGNHPDEQKFLP